MSRIKKLDRSQWDPELRERYCPDEASPLEHAAMGMFAHRPNIARGIIDFGAAIHADWSLSPRLRELVRLRVAYHNQCRSCMAIRYSSAVEDGVTEDLVCSLEKPMEATDLTDAEKAALAYADQFSTDHFSITDATFDTLREHFSEGQLVEIAAFVAYCVGFGRLGAALDMVEVLPETFQDKSVDKLTPWGNEHMVVP